MSLPTLPFIILYFSKRIISIILISYSWKSEFNYGIKYIQLFPKITLLNIRRAYIIIRI